MKPTYEELESHLSVLKEALEIAKKKRVFEGTANMIMEQMEQALNEISNSAKSALRKVEGK